jgi:hypothetical protein
MTEGQFHSKARKQSTLLNERQSLTELAVICTTAGGVWQANVPATRAHPNSLELATNYGITMVSSD